MQSESMSLINLKDKGHSQKGKYTDCGKPPPVKLVKIVCLLESQP